MTTFRHSLTNNFLESFSYQLITDYFLSKFFTKFNIALCFLNVGISVAIASLLLAVKR